MHARQHQTSTSTEPHWPREGDGRRNYHGYTKHVVTCVVDGSARAHGGVERNHPATAGRHTQPTATQLSRAVRLTAARTSEASSSSAPASRNSVVTFTLSASFCTQEHRHCCPRFDAAGDRHVRRRHTARSKKKSALRYRPRQTIRTTLTATKTIDRCWPCVIPADVPTAQKHDNVAGR